MAGAYVRLHGLCIAINADADRDRRQIHDEMIAGAVIAMTATTANAEQNKLVITPLAKTTSTITGQAIVLPQSSPEVTATIYEIPPKTRMPPHRHPHPRYGYMLSGQLRVTNTDTGQVSDFSAGDFVVEALQQWHVGENPGDVPLRLLVIDQAPAGTSNVEPKS
jgi:quercetin dioxygenase-like cupin family protein